MAEYTVVLCMAAGQNPRVRALLGLCPRLNAGPICDA